MRTRNTEVFHKCRECGKERWIAKYGLQRPTFTGLCAKCVKGLSRNGGRRYGQHITKEGYMLVRVYPDDSRFPMTQKSGYVKRSRLVMANHLGRLLSRDEQVHHKNGNKGDDRIENLELSDVYSHIKTHIQGYNDGYDKGYQDGLKQARKELQEVR